MTDPDSAPPEKPAAEKTPIGLDNARPAGRRDQEDLAEAAAHERWLLENRPPHHS